MGKRKNKLRIKRKTNPARTAPSRGQIRNANSRTIFKDPLLVKQFLQDNVDLPVFQNLSEDDIEDVTNQYQAYLGIEFESDTVKKIRLRHKDGNADTDDFIYLISLFEHKSKVDHNVAMQLLRYMTCIWYEYGKDAERKNPGCTRNKGFRYPPILPVVYYEGSKNWTADMRLQDRIWLSEALGEYMPDFSYRLVRIHDYSNDELINREDEMSLLMMINKVQTAEDLTLLLQSRKEQINKIIENTPERILRIITSTVWSLCIKMNLPEDEAADYVEKVKERNMGYLFENMDKIDIQAERRRTAKARKEREQAEKEKLEAEEKRKQVIAECDQITAERDQITAERDQIKGALLQAEKELAQSRIASHALAAKERENSIQSLIEICRKFGISQEQITSELEAKYSLSSAETREYISKYWEN